MAGPLQRRSRAVAEQTGYGLVRDECDGTAASDREEPLAERVEDVVPDYYLVRRARVARHPYRLRRGCRANSRDHVRGHRGSLTADRIHDVVGSAGVETQPGVEYGARGRETGACEQGAVGGITEASDRLLGSHRQVDDGAELPEHHAVVLAKDDATAGGNHRVRTRP